MGVPLDGTISTFQKKIADKGVSYNPKLSKIFPVGCRAFDGIFAGHKAEIIVYYDNKSKIVYRAKAVYTETSEEYCNQLYDEKKILCLKSMTEKKRIAKFQTKKV